MNKRGVKRTTKITVIASTVKIPGMVLQLVLITKTATLPAKYPYKRSLNSYLLGNEAPSSWKWVSRTAKQRWWPSFIHFKKHELGRHSYQEKREWRETSKAGEDRRNPVGKSLESLCSWPSIVSPVQRFALARRIEKKLKTNKSTESTITEKEARYGVVSVLVNTASGLSSEHIFQGDASRAEK